MKTRVFWSVGEGGDSRLGHPLDAPRNFSGGSKILRRRPQTYVSAKGLGAPGLGN